MANRILVYNPKGGQGKTTISVNFALYSAYDFFTNDYRTGSEDLYREKFPEGKFHAIDPDDIHILVPAKSVFDFGGWLDERIVKIASKMDLCIIPICYQSKADWQPFAKLIISLSKINSKIVIVINNTRREYVEQLLEVIPQTVGDYPVKVIKPSLFMGYLADQGETPFEIRGITGAPKKALVSLQDNLKGLFDSMMKY